MTKSVLITGGAGFIGSRLARRLVDRGYRVTAMDVLHPQVHRNPGRPADLPDDVHLVPADVTHAPDWEALLRLGSFEIVVHLAAETGTGQSLTEASRHGSVNVVGTTRMLDAMMAAGALPEQIVLASSRAVYGEGAWTDPEGRVHHPGVRLHADLEAGRWDPLDEAGRPLVHLPSEAGTTAPQPTNVYAATKLAQEHICRAWCAATGTALSVLRLQNVYGPGQALQNSYTGIVALFARLASGRHQIEVFEDGEIVRDFVFVDDVVDALAKAVDKPGDRTVDIGSGTPTTIRAVAETLASITGAPAPVVSGRFRDGDVRAASCSVEAAARELDWKPGTGLRQGLDSLLRWIADTGQDASPA